MDGDRAALSTCFFTRPGRTRELPVELARERSMDAANMVITLDATRAGRRPSRDGI